MVNLGGLSNTHRSPTIRWRLLRALMAALLLATTLATSVISLLLLTESWSDDWLSLGSALLVAFLFIGGSAGAFTLARSNRISIKYCALLVAVYVFTLLGIVSAESARRHSRYSDAARLARQLQVSLRQNKRFANIKVNATTAGSGGSVVVRGQLAAGATIDELRAEINRCRVGTDAIKVNYRLRLEPMNHEP